MPPSLESAGMRALGLLTGLAFGALLQRGRLSRYDVIAKQMLSRDSTVAKTMGSAVAVGVIGIPLLAKHGLTSKDIKPMKVGGVLAGAALFGAGLALTGYCPGTSVAAAGEGRRDALAVVLGMFFGATAFVAAYPRVLPVIEAGGDWGKKTLPALVTNTL